MDLTTRYLGLELTHPLMPGASPLVDDLDNVKRLEDAGASAIVMRSLFEEQITRERFGTIRDMEIHADSYAEALSYFPEPESYALGPDRYLEQVRKIKATVKVPVIGSLNGTSVSGWVQYARLIQQAGADALELNVYQVAASLWVPGETVEARIRDVVRAVKREVTIPVAVKLSPFFSSMAHVARQLDDLGVEGLVLFNRFYQPDLDPEELEVIPSLHLSDPSELLLRLRWLAILCGRVQASLSASGGVHGPRDVVKAIAAGADTVQVVSALLRHGPSHLAQLRKGLVEWMEEHEYASVSALRGCLSLQTCPDPGAFERANYMRVLHGWRPEVEETDWRM